MHAALRGEGVAVRRGGTFPGLDDSWVRIAARPPEQTGRLLAALDKVRAGPRTRAARVRAAGVRAAGA
jgi:histidinol-phosphate/aromatic aminotransferase/cobyric acid decarboxylase-like protein